jgi:hypothetical protein
MKPPQILKTSITNSSSAENTVVDGSEAMTSDSSLLWGDSTYEILRREGELHEGRATVLDELQRNFARLSDLHGQLHFVLNEVESLLRFKA